ncbi:autotransporter outer membrane beta-barrel domain-containing protein [Variovorax sp. LARHSF232]
MGRRIDAGAVALEPFAQLAYAHLSTDSINEQGGPAALTGGGDSFDSTFSTLGARATAQIDERTRLTGMVGWRHAFGETTPQSTVAFAGTATTFVIGGVPLARNVAVLEAGVEAQLAKNLRIGAWYAGQFGSGLRDNGIKATLSYRF